MKPVNNIFMAFTSNNFIVIILMISSVSAASLHYRHGSKSQLNGFLSDSFRSDFEGSNLVQNKPLSISINTDFKWLPNRGVKQDGMSNANNERGHFAQGIDKRSTGPVANFQVSLPVKKIPRSSNNQIISEIKNRLPSNNNKQIERSYRVARNTDESEQSSKQSGGPDNSIQSQGISRVSWNTDKQIQPDRTQNQDPTLKNRKSRIPPNRQSNTALQGRGKNVPTNRQYEYYYDASNGENEEAPTDGEAGYNYENESGYDDTNGESLDQGAQDSDAVGGETEEEYQEYPSEDATDTQEGDAVDGEAGTDYEDAYAGDETESDGTAEDANTVDETAADETTGDATADGGNTSDEVEVFVPDDTTPVPTTQNNLTTSSTPVTASTTSTSTASTSVASTSATTTTTITPINIISSTTSTPGSFFTTTLGSYTRGNLWMWRGKSSTVQSNNNVFGQIGNIPNQNSNSFGQIIYVPNQVSNSFGQVFPSQNEAVNPFQYVPSQTSNPFGQINYLPSQTISNSLQTDPISGQSISVVNESPSIIQQQGFGVVRFTGRDQMGSTEPDDKQSGYYISQGYDRSSRERGDLENNSRQEHNISYNNNKASVAISSISNMESGTSRLLSVEPSESTSLDNKIESKANDEFTTKKKRKKGIKSKKNKNSKKKLKRRKKMNKVTTSTQAINVGNIDNAESVPTESRQKLFSSLYSASNLKDVKQLGDKNEENLKKKRILKKKKLNLLTG